MNKIRKTLNSRISVFIQVILFFLLSNYVLSGVNCRMDVSKNGRFTLTRSTKQILNELPDTLYIDAFYSSEIPPEYKSRLLLTQELLKEMANVNPSMVQYRFYDPDSSEEDKERAIKAGVEPQTLQKVEMGSAQVKSAFLGVSLRLGKQVETIPVVFFAEEAEYQILSTVKKMIRREKSISSGVAILQENGSMRAPQPGPGSGKDTFGVFMHQIFAREYGPAFPFGINQEPLPADIRLLIVAGSPELTELGMYHLDQFIMRGGKLFILPKSMDFQLDEQNSMTGLGMGSKGFAQSVQNTEKWNEFLSHYGFKIQTNMILEPNHSMPMGPLIQMDQGMMGRYHYPLWIVASQDGGLLSETSPFTRDMEFLLLPWASGLSILPDNQKNAKFEIFIHSSTEAIVKENFLFIGEKEVHSINEEPKGEEIPIGIHIHGQLTSYFAGKDLPKGVNPTSFIQKSNSYEDLTNTGLSGGEDTVPELLVVSSPYIISDILVVRDFRDIYQGANVPFFMNALDILQGDADLVASRAKKPAFEALQNITSKEELFYSIVNILFLPMGIAMYAFFRIRKRNPGKGVE